MAPVFTAFLLAALITVAAPLPVSAQSGSDDPVLGAEGCKSCHAEIYAAWAKTRHAKALDALPAANRTNATCVACHVTVVPGASASDILDADHPNVQCEACHGPGRAHATKAAAGTPTAEGLAKVPNAKNCETCHNDRSPSFKGFYYSAMKNLVHRR